MKKIKKACDQQSALLLLLLLLLSLLLPSASLPWVFSSPETYRAGA